MANHHHSRQKSLPYGVDLVHMAIAQRVAVVLAVLGILLIVLGAVAIVLMPINWGIGPQPPPSRPLNALLLLSMLGHCIYVAVAIGLVIWFCKRMNFSLFETIVGALLVPIPVVASLVLLVLVTQINEFFRDTPVKFGWLGPDIESACSAQNPSLCRGCGYDLTGNVSGRCPECGRIVESSR